MLTAVELEIDKDLQLADGVNRRATLRRAAANRLRPRFNALRDRVRQVTLYPSIAPFFIVEQATTEDAFTIQLENTSRIASILEAPEGSPEHTIIQDPHNIPIVKLVEWLQEKGGMSDGAVMQQALRIQRILSLREIVIQHPGTRPDTPVQQAIDEAEPGLLASAEDALEYWANRFGVTDEGEF